MAVTGLAMIIFLIEHVSGNLLLYSKNPDPYNKYAHFLISFGWLVIAAELILLAVLLFHVVSGVSISLGKKRARPVGYSKTANAGEPSKKTVASTTMIYTGLITLIFLAVHLKTFKFGPNYDTVVDGQTIRDLHKLVMETFQKPVYVLGYVASMIFLGFHLRHGFWSAFQSLGIHHPRYTPIIYTVGMIVAVVVAVGFLGIPIWVYFTGAGS